MTSPDFVFYSDPVRLREVAPESFLVTLTATAARRFPAPDCLLELRQGGLRDDLIRFKRVGQYDRVPAGQRELRLGWWVTGSRMSHAAVSFRFASRPLTLQRSNPPARGILPLVAVDEFAGGLPESPLQQVRRLSGIERCQTKEQRVHRGSSDLLCVGRVQ